jgi:hypothetical protein
MLYKFIKSDVEFIAEVDTTDERIFELVEEYHKVRDKVAWMTFLHTKGITAELVLPRQIFI